MKARLFLFSSIWMVFSFGATDFADTLFTKQWALKNTGQGILYAEDELSRNLVEGIPGVDLDWVSLGPYSIPVDREVIVAVIDSGLDIYHPDLKGRIWLDEKRCPNGSDSVESQGLPCHGMNLLESNGNIADDTGHGTHVAGIIAANANSIGIVGAADSRVKVMPVKVLSQETRSFVYKGRLITDIIADGIHYAIANGADVINMSLGWPKVVETPKVKKALQMAVQKEIPIIVAAGNNNKNIPVFPCSNKGVICVGSIGNTGEISEFSNFGGKIDLLAPGEFIVSTYPSVDIESRILRMKGYEAKKGTSQAAPFVAAIAANMKLMNPDIKLGELKAKLLASPYGERKGLKQKVKRSKFGIVSMRRALQKTPSVFITPDFKNLLDIKFNRNTGSFSFELPIESLIGVAENVEVALEFSGSQVLLEKGLFQLDRIEEGESKRIFIRGKVVNLFADNNVDLFVSIKTGDFQQRTSTALMFARDLKREENIKKWKFTDLTAHEVTFFKGIRKLSKLKTISDIFHQKKNPEFFVVLKKRQTDRYTVVTIVEMKNNYQMVSRELKLPKLNQVLAIFINDTNRDGKLDYFIYGLNEKRTHLTFDHYTRELQPLFGKYSRWEFKISEFEGLPLKNGFQENFLWLAQKVEGLGNVTIPAIFKKYKLPSEDNTEDILDRYREDLKAPHLYYLNPVLRNGKVTISLRAFDSFDFLESLRRKLKIGFRSSIRMEKPFFQSREDRSRGRVKALISYGREFKKSYLLIDITEVSKFKLQPVPINGRLLAGNSIFAVRDINEGGSYLNSATFLALLNRSQARAYVYNPNNNSYRATVLKTDSWSDPIFNYIAGFNDPKGTFFLESRYFVHAVDSEGNRQKLPINRDSTFPGVSFSETLEPIVVNYRERSRPGIFINSTLIFGDRLYTMVKTDGDFIRPIELSVAIPDNCAYLAPHFLGEKAKAHYMMLCRVGSSEVEMWALPIEVN